MPKTKQTKQPQPKQWDIPSAIRYLRQLSAESQQFFGARLRISTRALQLYESGDRVPEPKQLVAFAAYADFMGLPELTELFIGELERQLAPPPGYEFCPRQFFLQRRGVIKAGPDAILDVSEVNPMLVPGIHRRKK